MFSKKCLKTRVGRGLLQWIMLTFYFDDFDRKQKYSLNRMVQRFRVNEVDPEQNPPHIFGALMAGVKHFGFSD